MKKAVFLDRDGTINFDPGYMSSAHDLEILPGVFEALKLLLDNDFLLIVVTNQSGLARGLITIDELTEIHKKMDRLFSEHGISILEYFYCSHKPEDKCNCRKPSPRLLQDAAVKWNIDLKSSYMVGDKRTDILAGLNAGVKGVSMVRTGCGKEEETGLGELLNQCFITNTLFDAAQWIVKMSEPEVSKR